MRTLLDISSYHLVQILISIHLVQTHIFISCPTLPTVGNSGSDSISQPGDSSFRTETIHEKKMKADCSNKT